MFNGGQLNGAALNGDGAEGCCSQESAVFGAAPLGAWCLNGGSATPAAQAAPSAGVALEGVSAAGQAGLLAASASSAPQTPKASGGGGGPGRPRPVWDAKVSLRGASARAAVGSLALWASEPPEPAPAYEPEPSYEPPLVGLLVPLVAPVVRADASARLTGLQASLAARPDLGLGAEEAVFDAELEELALNLLAMS